MSSPFDNLLNNLKKGFETIAEELIDDLNKQARQNLRDMAKAAGKATRPLPRGNKRATRGRKGNTVPPPDKSQMATVPTLYDFLEVSKYASPETISAAFRSLSTRYHPDKKGGDQERYKDITAAWTVLKDPKSRERYDRHIGVR